MQRLVKIFILGALLAGVFLAVQGPLGEDASRPQIVISDLPSTGITVG